MALEGSLPSLLADLQRTLSTLSVVLSSHDGSRLASHPLISSVQLPALLMPPPPSIPNQAPLPPPFTSPNQVSQPGSIVPPSRPLFVDLIRQSILAQPVTQSRWLHPVPSRNRASSKIQHLRALAKAGMAICYRCGESGHLTAACRSSLVCLSCRQTSHHSSSCRFIHPPPLAPLPDPASPQPGSAPPQPRPAFPHPNPAPLIPPLAPLPIIASPQPSSLVLNPVPIAMVPPPSQACLLEANTLPVMRYYATPAFFSGVMLRFVS